MSGSENVGEELVAQNEEKVEGKKVDEKKESRKKHNKLPIEGSGSLELNLFKGPKTWKKSITQFFRNQLRSTRSNDGDGPSGSVEQFPETEVSPEQKWQSLGKVFRRGADAWGGSGGGGGGGGGGKDGADPPVKKAVAVKRVLSSYFGKSPKPLPAVTDD